MFPIFGQKGFDEDVAGHLIVRVEVTMTSNATWLILPGSCRTSHNVGIPFRCGIQHMQRSDLLRTDYQGIVLAGGRNKLINRAAGFIYAAGNMGLSVVLSMFAKLSSSRGTTRCHSCRYQNQIADAALRVLITFPAHTHSLYGRTYSTLGMPLPIAPQDGCGFYNVRIYRMSLACLTLRGPLILW